jgi:thiamine pyrophosphate-dependent acetolactate synthase large subunit-like protein
MSRTTSDVMVERLIDWGVRVVFGLTRRSRPEGLDSSAQSHPRSPWNSATRC